MTASNGTLRVLVTVGSDHHPFDRLVRAVDKWVETGVDVALVTQHGTARPPEHGEAYSYMPHEELMARMGTTDLLVTQGGPMGIIESRRLGIIPIVMPRLKAEGEVVDDHQVDLCRHLNERGDVWLVEEADQVASVLDRALANPAALRIDPIEPGLHVRESVDHFAAAVASLPTGRRWFRRRS